MGFTKSKKSIEERDSILKQTLDSDGSFNKLSETRMNSNSCLVKQDIFELKSHDIVDTNPNKSSSYYDKYCDNDSEIHELSNVHSRKKSVESSVTTNSSNKIYLKEVTKNSNNMTIVKPKITLTETGSQNLSLTMYPKQIMCGAVSEMNEVFIVGSENKASSCIDKNFISNKSFKNSTQNYLNLTKNEIKGDDNYLNLEEQTYQRVSLNCRNIETPKEDNVVLQTAALMSKNTETYESMINGEELVVKDNVIKSTNNLKTQKQLIEKKSKVDQENILKSSHPIEFCTVPRFQDISDTNYESNKIPTVGKSSQTNTKVENSSISSIENSSCNTNASKINAVNQNIEMISLSSLSDNAENILPTTPLLQKPLFVDEIDFKKIDDLREKLRVASKKDGCQWTFIELDDKEAVFEILHESAFACYHMHVPVSFGSQAPSETKITFTNPDEDLDDVAKLGFLYFLKLVSKYTVISSFSIDRLLENMQRVIECALQAKSLIKDIYFISISNGYSINFCDDFPRLVVEIFNFNHYSFFTLTFPINFESYPQEKIIPEINHLEYHEMPREIILGALDKIQPGTYYLRNMARAVDEL